VTGTYAEKKHALGNAVRYADRASKKEILYIKNAAAAFDGDATTAIAGYETITELYPDEKEAFMRLGRLYRDANYDMEKSRAAFEKVIAIDPLDKNGYNNLAYLYNFIGDFEKSIWAINQYINLAQDEPNPYDSRADLYAYNGKIDEAAESYRKALEKKADFYPSMIKLGHMALFQQDYEAAAEYYGQVSREAEEDFSRWARILMAYIPLYRGDFEATLSEIDGQIERDRIDGYGGGAYLNKLSARSYIRAALGDHDRAISAANEYKNEYRRLRPTDDEWWKLHYGFMMFYCDETEAAEEMLGAFLTSIDSLNEAKMMGYATLKGLLEMRAGRGDAACSYLERANRNIKFFSRQFWLGRVYLEAGRADEARSVFEDMLHRYPEDRADAPMLSVSAWYYAGLACDRAGDTESARGYYRRFLEYWGAGDPVPHEVSEARTRLASMWQDI
jgi:tetratricopeptide (TPR) repeat protein